MQLKEQRVVSANQHGIVSLRDREGRVGSALQFDLLVLATGIAVPGWVQRRTDLETDEEGSVVVRETLQSTRSEFVFGAGECCSLIKKEGIAKATSTTTTKGVSGIRAGPILAHNVMTVLQKLCGCTGSSSPFSLASSWASLTAALVSSSTSRLQVFVPQEDSPPLLCTGDGSAIGSKLGVALQGKWVWRLKDWSDQSWMSRFRTGEEDQTASDDDQDLLTGLGEQEAESYYSSSSVRARGSTGTMSTVASNSVGHGREEGAGGISAPFRQYPSMEGITEDQKKGRFWEEGESCEGKGDGNVVLASECVEPAAAASTTSTTATPVVFFCGSSETDSMVSDKDEDEEGDDRESGTMALTGKDSMGRPTDSSLGQWESDPMEGVVEENEDEFAEEWASFYFGGR